ncbi:MAG: nucleoside triphosphate pyrophosphohydrolase [Pseudomonadota bacterium]
MTKFIRFKFDKLVRDDTADFLESIGIKVNSTIVKDAEYTSSLCKKLVEEANEVKQATTKDEIKEELADVFEVMRALMINYQINFNELVVACENKNNRKGSFKKGVYCDYIDIPEGHERLEYFRNNDAYPEMK